MFILDFLKSQFSNEQKQAYSKLTDTYEKQFSHIAVDLLAHRHEFIEKFAKYYKHHFKEYKNAFPNSNDRLLIHAAFLTAIQQFLTEIYNLQDYWTDFLQYMAELIDTHESRTDSLKHTRLFWEAFAIGIKNRYCFKKCVKRNQN